MKPLSTNPQEFGMAEIKVAHCVRCGKESKVWGEILFREDMIAALTLTVEEAKSKGQVPEDSVPPPANKWLPFCPPCMHEFESMSHMTLGFSDEGNNGERGQQQS